MSLRLCRIAVALELPAVLAMAPALLFPTPLRLVVLAAVPVMWFCAWRVDGHAVPRTPLNWALWLLLATVGVSLWATFDIASSIGKVSGVLLGVLLFWSIARSITTRDRLARAVALFVLAGGGLAVVGLLGTKWLSKIHLLGLIAERIPRVIQGIPGATEGFHPNAVAGCLVLFLPLQVAVLGSREGRELWPRIKGPWAIPGLITIQVILLLLTSGTLLLTQSRGAFLGLAVALGAFLLWHSRPTRIGATLIMLALVFTLGTIGPERLADAALSSSGRGITSTISGRVELWSRAVYVIQDFPLTGIGMNTFRTIMPVLYPTFLMESTPDIAHAHNHFLQAALDLGVPGLVAYLSIWIVIASMLGQVYRRTRERIFRTLARAIGGGLIAHSVFSLTDAIPIGAKVGVLFWLTLALVVGLHRVATYDDGRVEVTRFLPSGTTTVASPK